jgi:hypothetical protein
MFYYCLTVDKRIFFKQFEFTVIITASADLDCLPRQQQSEGLILAVEFVDHTG